MNEPATDLPVALLQGTGAALVAITLSAPLASTAGVAAIAGPLRRVLPGAASVLHAFAAGCQRLRARDKLFVASHAMITYACGDLLVQLASHTGGGPISYAPLRTLRNSAAGIISDALPFYYWSSLLAGVGSTTARPLSWARDCRHGGALLACRSSHSPTRESRRHPDSHRRASLRRGFRRCCAARPQR